MFKCMVCRVTTTMEMTGRCTREASFGSIRSTLWAGLLGRVIANASQHVGRF